MEKLILTVVAILTMATMAQADQYVNGYIRSDGTYVAPYVRSTPDSSYNNNYGTKGNSNPYNGNYGSERPTYNDRTPEYNQKHYGDENKQPSLYNNNGPRQPSLYGK